MPDVSETLRSRGILCDLAMHVERMSCGLYPVRIFPALREGTTGLLRYHGGAPS